MSENSKAAAGCFGVIGMILVGSCVFAGGSNDRPAGADSQAATAIETPAASAESGSERPSPEGSVPSPADVSEAEGTVAFIIGLNGYHCIKVLDVQAAGSGVYDVTCVTDHRGHQAIYMVNSRTNDVAEI